MGIGPSHRALENKVQPVQFHVGANHDAPPDGRFGATQGHLQLVERNAAAALDFSVHLFADSMEGLRYRLPIENSTIVNDSARRWQFSLGGAVDRRRKSANENCQRRALSFTIVEIS